MQHCMSDLADIDRPVETHLHARIPGRPDPVLGVADVHGRDGRVVADLLGHQSGGAFLLGVGPGGEEELAEEGVERLLDAAVLGT